MYPKKIDRFFFLLHCSSTLCSRELIIIYTLIVYLFFSFFPVYVQERSMEVIQNKDPKLSFV